MGRGNKRKSAALIESDSQSSDSDSGSDIDKDMLSLTKKKGTATKAERKQVEALSSSDSDSEWGSTKGKKSSKKQPAKRARRSASGATRSSVSDDDDSSKSSSDNGSDDDEKVNLPPTSSSVVSSSVGDIGSRKAATASDLEEGEVSDDDADQEFFDGYDENFMGDADDRKRLDAMTEKEREQEIFMRSERRDVLRNRFEAEKKLKMKKKLETRMLAKRAGLKVEDALLETDPTIDAKIRSQERKKTVEGKVDKKSQAMDALKASRDAKKQRAEEREREKKNRQESERKRDDGDDDMDFKRENDSSSVVGDKKQKKLKASDVYSDDSGSDSDDDVKKERRSSDSDSRSSDSEDEDRNKKPHFIESVNDLNKMRLSRAKIVKWLYFPFFEKLIQGCYVRVGLAAPPGQRSTYRVYEIVGVDTQLKIYEFDKIKTNKVLILRLPGDDVEDRILPDGSKKRAGRKFRIEYISNSSFSEDEYQQWRQRMEQHQIAFPTMDDVNKKEKEINNAVEYELKEEDIEKIIVEKAKLKSTPVNFAARKTELMKMRDTALSNGDNDRATEISQEIQELDAKANILDKQRTTTISSISYINERNRKRNVEEAEKAIMEELKMNKGMKVEDPFTRRTTKPRIVSKPALITNGVDIFKTEVKTEGDNNESKTLEDTKLANLTIDEPDSTTSDKKSILDLKPDLDNLPQVGDLFSAHDFDIKLDLDAKLPPSFAIISRPSAAPMKETAPRRSLNLEEYKRKKGLI